MDLDALLTKMNEALAGRQEGDLRLDDPYWEARETYRLALHRAGGVHHHSQPGVTYNKLPDAPVEVPVEAPDEPDPKLTEILKAFN